MDNLAKERPVFLDQITFSDMTDTASVPVIDGWEWSLSSTGQGQLTDPQGHDYCVFDLLSGDIDFAGDGSTITAPGLSLNLVQEMGEKYVYQTKFTSEEQGHYDAHVQTRPEVRRKQDHAVRNSLRGVVQLHYDHGLWSAHVDVDRVKGLMGIETKEVLSRKEGTELFHQMCSTLHVQPLINVDGYVTRDNNTYDTIHKEYRNQYENMLQAIENRVVDGSVYGVAHVLEHPAKALRRDQNDFLPKGIYLGDLRFVEVTPDQQDAIRNFVKCRVSLTLIHGEKRSYEQSTQTRAMEKYRHAGAQLRETLQSACDPLLTEQEDESQGLSM